MNTNKIRDLLKQVEVCDMLSAGIKYTFQTGNAYDFLKMVAELKELDEMCPIIVLHALKDSYDEIKSLWN